MDFAELYKDTQTVEIKGPNSDEVFISMEIRSPASEEVRAVDRARRTAELKSRGGRLSAKDEEVYGAARLCALIASWDWKDGLTFEGETPDNSEAFKRKVIASNSQASVEIMRRIAVAMEDEEAFTKPSKEG